MDRGSKNFYLKKNFGLRLNLIQAMQMASQQSELGLEQTSPNPCVGSVILDRKDELVGLGYHKKFGGPHAEVEAFQTLPEELKSNPEELSVFVTLEPCAHQGKTPSCARMLATKKVKRVVYLLKDPNPLVAGEGQMILDAAGVQTYCVEDILQKQKFYQPDEILKAIYKFKKNLKALIKKQKNLNRQFLFAMQSELPYITLKWAQTLDGTIGLPSERLLITNQEVQKEVHHLRACHDVVVVGAGTVLQDDPKLNNRFGSSKNKLNRICIFDQDLKVFEKRNELKIFRTHEKGNLILVTHSSQNIDQLQAEGFNFLQVNFDSNNSDVLDLTSALKQIKAKYKINSVFVEGGQKLLSSFLAQNLFNEIYIFNALKIQFKKDSIRLHIKFWIKHLFKNLLSMRIKTFEADFLIHFRK